MKIRLKKGRDGPDSLACVRDDGTSTWRRIQRGLAVHDLAHHAVESELGVADGFFALVAGGWSFESFADAEERKRIPPGAIRVELLVNRFLTEAANGELLDPESFDAEPEQIARIRARIAAHVARWRSLPPGETLELRFDPPVRHEP